MHAICQAVRPFTSSVIDFISLSFKLEFDLGHAENGYIKNYIANLCIAIIATMKSYHMHS